MSRKLQRFLFVLILPVLAWFLWYGNINPLLLNSSLNRAVFESETGQCGRAYQRIGGIGDNGSIQQYIAAQKVNVISNCFGKLPSQQELAVKGVELLRQGEKLRPTYTRFWNTKAVYLTSVARFTKDLKEVAALAAEADEAFQKAEELSPNRAQGFFLKKAELYLETGQHERAIQFIEKECPRHRFSGRCDWYLAFANIGLGKFAEADANLIEAASRWDDHLLTSESRLNQLASQYVAFVNSTQEAQKRKEAYERIRGLYELAAFSYWPKKAQYHASLALVYKELGQYDKARAQAQLVKELNPAAAPEVELFLQALPAE